MPHPIRSFLPVLGAVVLSAGAVLPASVRAQGPCCYANCDKSIVSPVLNANDFQCFLSRYAAGDAYANCDGSTTPPFLNANDFQCFLNAYAEGCNGRAGTTCYPGNPNPNAQSEREWTGTMGRGCAASSSVPDPSLSAWLFSGEFHTEAVDMQIMGRGMDFVWARRYRSQLGPDTALGHNWDFGYNIYVEFSGADLVLHNGQARQDTYGLQPDGSWAREEFYRDIVRNPDQSFTLTFADMGRWHFHSLAGPAAGKIASIVDRNSNTMSFTYDEFGRLSAVTDTLGRVIALEYDASSRIANVTDFSGRRVQYQYYTGEAGGSPGDLKSVTGPAVTGTPNGNDYPEGKTTLFTYTSGSPVPQLNHNLLTITDPKGQVFLTNEYDASLNSASLNFDRVIRQTLGNSGETLAFVYAQQTPSPGNGNAVIKAIVNDRVGNVSEYLYDDRNRLVVERFYTGRWPVGTFVADPAAPPPIPRLRATDPGVYQTRWTYNNDSLVIRRDDPNGNFETFSYDSANSNHRAHGNLLQRCDFPGPLSGDQAQLCESFEYFGAFGGCCGTSFVTRHIDPRGSQTLHTYDSRGNRLHTQHAIASIVEDWEYNLFGQQTAHTLPDNGSGHRRRDTSSYYSTGPQAGYVFQTVVDALPGLLALTITYEHDLRGNVVRVVDARGNDTLFSVNQLDQVVRERSRAVALPAGTVRYLRDAFYDANNNTVRVDVQNVDDQGAVVEANPAFTTIWDYEILNQPIRVCQEFGTANLAASVLTSGAIPAGMQSAFIITEYGYDGNRNRTLERYGEAVAGGQPFNTLTQLYDERELLFRSVRAQGAPGSGGQSSAQYDYDGNTNPTRVSAGIESSPRETVSVYDGYNRRVSTIDPMGNVTEQHYDANGNLGGNQSESPPIANPFASRVTGQLMDVPGSAGGVRLSELTYTYDGMNRRVREDVRHFDIQTQAAIGDGQSTTITNYSDASQVLSVTNDNGHSTLTAYDTANRIRVVTDALGNTTTSAYDSNSNVVSVVQVDRSDIGGPDESFTTTNQHDALDRLISSTDNAGNSRQSGYDSRNNLVLATSARGNRTRFVYDGVNRLVQSVNDMDANGVFTDPADITTGQTWDRSSRLIGQTDDRGNTTVSQFDALNRLIRTTNADTTFDQHTYDVHNNRVQTTDANGSVISSTFDLRDRLSGRTVTRASGVLGTTGESYQYDGLSRMILAQDDDSLVVRGSASTSGYDSMANVIRETQQVLPGGPSRVIACVYDGAHNQIRCTYPGGRIIATTYDALERKSSITDGVGGPLVAQYRYVGPERAQRVDRGNGTRTMYNYDGISGVPNPPGDFGVKRVIGMTHSLIASGAIIDDRTYRWDPDVNKVERRDVRLAGPRLTHNYTYDAADRLIGTIATQPGGGTLRDEQYSLDGVGNRTSVTGGLHPGAYSCNGSFPEPADCETNQYTTTSFDARSYDRNGNLISISLSSRTIAFDYRNQMVEYRDGATGAVTRRSYDVLGRRIEKSIDPDGPGPSSAVVTRFLLDGDQEIEEQDGVGGSTLATYVFGPYIDEVVQMRRAGTDYYFHADDMYNVMAVSNTTGVVVERYDYQDYGQPEFYTAGNAPLSQSAIGNSLLFTGRRYEAETGWFYFRSRDLDPQAGRFLMRDRIGIWTDSSNAGNGYTYVGNRPLNFTDPMGEILCKLGCDITYMGKKNAAKREACKKACDAASSGSSGSSSGSGGLCAYDVSGQICALKSSKIRCVGCCGAHFGVNLGVQAILCVVLCPSPPCAAACVAGFGIFDLINFGCCVKKCK